MLRPLHVFGNVYSGHVEERFGEIDVGHQVVVARAGLDDPFPHDDKGHADAFFVHVPFVEQPVFTQEETLVGGVDHDRVFVQAGLFEVVEDLSDALVHGFDARQVILHVAVVLVLDQFTAAQGVAVDHQHLRGRSEPFGQRVGRQSRRRGEFEVVVGVPVGNGHFVVLQRGFPGGVVVPESFGDGEGLVLVFFPQVGTGLERTVRCLVVAHEHEGTVFRSVFDEFDRLVGNQVGRIAAFVPCAAFCRIHDGIVVKSLSGEDIPVVETRGVGREVPFSDHGRGVSGLLQQFGEGLLRSVKFVEDRGAVEVAVLAGEHRCPRRGRDGVGGKAVVKHHSVLGQAVHVRGVGQGLVVRRDGVGSVVVREDEDHVGPLGRRLCRRLLGVCSGQGEQTRGTQRDFL